MYAMSIIAQSRPSEETSIESDPEYASYWKDLHREYYIPIQHGMMILSLIGFASSLHCLWSRWSQFKEKAFSPAHMAFVFPILSHTNSIQAYRSGFNTFSNDPLGSPFHLVLYMYWLSCLLVGTCLNLIFTYKYIKRLPKWTKVDEALFSGDTDEIPPSPNHTLVHEMMSVGSYSSERDRRDSGIPHEILHQTFTSPAVLQANEAGALIRVRRGTEDYEHYGPYVRTRNVSSLGFDLTMTLEELKQEHAELLHWVAKTAPRTRHRTLSIPQMFKLRGGSEEGAPLDEYGTFHSGEAADRQAPDGWNPAQNSAARGHQRSRTWGPWAVYR